MRLGQGLVCGSIDGSYVSFVCVKEMSQLVFSEESTTSESKRTRGLSKKLTGYVLEKNTSGCCPGCNKYVSDNEGAVVCNTCDAYWHFACAMVTEEEIKQLGDDEFYCQKHSNGLAVVESNMVEMESIECNTSDLEDNQTEILNIKMVPYILNTKKLWKAKLRDLKRVLKIDRKDNGKQYVIVVNTVTYTILINSIKEVGEICGLQVKRADVDPKYNDLQVQYDGKITKQNFMDVPVTITFYHTKNSMLIQVKGERNGVNWTDKLDMLQTFVNVTISGLLNEIEKMTDYEDIKENIKAQLTSENKDGLPVTLGKLDMIRLSHELDKKEINDIIENEDGKMNDEGIDNSLIMPRVKVDESNQQEVDGAHSSRGIEVVKTAHGGEPSCVVEEVETTNEEKIAGDKSLNQIGSNIDCSDTSSLVSKQNTLSINSKELTTSPGSSQGLGEIGLTEVKPAHVADIDNLDNSDRTALTTSNQSYTGLTEDQRKLYVGMENQTKIPSDLQMIKYGEETDIENMNQIVLVKNRSNKENKWRKDMMQSFYETKNNTDEKTCYLYNIILKLKEKYCQANGKLPSIWSATGG